MFDRVIIGPALIAKAAPTAWTCEVHRVLKPGGELLVVDMLARSLSASDDGVEDESGGLLDIVEVAAENFALDSTRILQGTVAIRAFREGATAASHFRFLKSFLVAATREMVRVADECKSHRTEHERLLNEHDVVLDERDMLRRSLAHAEVRLEERALVQQSLGLHLGELSSALGNAIALSQEIVLRSESRIESDLRTALKRASAQAKRTEAQLQRTEVQLQHERWKLASLKQRKWNRMGAVLAGSTDRPWTLLLAVFRAGAIAFGKSRPPLAPPTAPSATLEDAKPKPKPEPQPKHKPTETAKLLREFPPYEPDPLVGKKRPIKVASILDEFSEMAFKFECELLPVPRAGWQEHLEQFAPDILLVESAWNANGGDWKYALTGSGTSNVDLLNLLECCKNAQIPTVFWNKEDPLEYDQFLEPARHFDWVFTVDDGCIDRYQEDLGHQRVGVLPFAVQPSIHNPVDSFADRPKRLAFAGAHYPNKYPERKLQIENLLVPCVDLGLEIFSRFATNANYRFPPPLDKAVIGSLDYGRMLTAYRRYQVFLNVNSVTDSRTMFSRRALELAACGTPVVSGPSPGLESMVDGGVIVSTDAETSKLAVKSLLQSKEVRDRMAVKGIRAVFSRHTYGHRLEQILSEVGVDTPPIERQRVTVVAATNKPGMYLEILDSVSRQRHPDIELIVALHGIDEDENRLRGAADERGVQRLQIAKFSQKHSLGEVLNRSIDMASGDFIAKMDDDDFYGENYLSDQLLAFSYTRADIVGKWTRFVSFKATDRLGILFPGFEHKYSELVGGGTILARRYVFDQVKFPDRTVGEDTHFLRRCSAVGLTTYSTDRFNFVYRRQSDPGKHTYAVDDLQHLANTRIVAVGAGEGHASI